jgi:glycerol-3-phosphate acyltransferase PlsX
MRKKTNQLVRVAVDLLGSDTPPEKLLLPLLELQEELKDKLAVTFFIPPALATQIPSHASAIVCDEVITMEDDPLVVVRTKKNASLVQGVQLLKNREVDAFISAGNTGALLASCQLSLPLLEGIERAALLTLLPTMRHEVVIIDVGANLSCKSQHLVQFAQMGLAYQKSRGVEKPTFGLLNIGTEPKKGTPELRETYQKLKELFQNNPSAHFLGNIEGRDVFKGELDILVTDGFAGNIFLKTAEGLGEFVLELLEESLSEIEFSPLKGTLSTLKQRLDYSEYPGAILCGIDGIVVKCHGKASPQSFVSSVKGAIRLVQHGFLEKIKHELFHTF